MPTAGDGARPVKRSLTLSGHRTSVTLEAPFWEAFAEMAAAEGASLNALAARIDAGRAPEATLASALRVAVLAWARKGPARRSGPPPGGEGPRPNSGHLKSLGDFS